MSYISVHIIKKYTGLKTEYQISKTLTVDIFLAITIISPSASSYPVNYMHIYFLSVRIHKRISLSRKKQNVEIALFFFL